MSGLALTGIVLGVLPLAIEVFDRYAEVARRIDVFLNIKAEYLAWSRGLKYNKVLYERNLKELLLPLMIDDATEKDKIPELIKDPLGTWWTEPKTAGLLKARLHDCYEVYMDYIRAMEQVMEDVVDELAFGNSSVQGKITTPGEASVIARLTALRDSDNRSFQWHRFKFALKGPEKRTQLLTKLEDYNRKLRELLEGSDRLRDLSAKTPVVTQSNPVAIDTALCNFWLTADTFFIAIASSWNCRCKTHCANLLLRHRNDATAEFEVLFTKEQPSPATWNVRKTRIVGKQGVSSKPEEEAQTRMTSPLEEEVTLVDVEQGDESANASTGSARITTPKKIIHCLCTALETPVSSTIPGEREPSYGYLINQDITYHIYDMPYHLTQHHTTVTLQDIIDADLFQDLERRRRCSLALTIASSFVQLLGSPWLPTTITKKGIIFLLDPNPSAQSLAEDKPAFLNEPYVHQTFVGKKSTRIVEEAMSIADSLDQLGIILLELGFGKRLKDQPCRRRYEEKFAAPNDHVRSLYDVLAARDWQEKVLGEAGQDYAAAVNWCLGGNRSGSKVEDQKQRIQAHRYRGHQIDQLEPSIEQLG
ncbi:uncharacterized protein B0T23DRAFT_327865 [Neurospora hispaniola]|uniref:DUF7580 domain-containing protein n=1 Tax=Neurospora hispaniola TaxID=588809 RepID=A0AAJ0HYE6_9PEZI|nr:hypothetical protein B0T23DRAFT_327865 [Neurospora hispaniola]